MNGDTSNDQKLCEDTLRLVLDSVQLCRLLLGVTEACSFDSIFSDMFTRVAMKHLCAANPDESLPSKVITPHINTHEFEKHGDQAAANRRASNSALGENQDVNGDTSPMCDPSRLEQT